MYVLLTTYPAGSSANVGDLLIEESVKALVREIKGEHDFLTVFREDPLDDLLDEINRSRAVLMPAFPIRDTPMYPRTYRLTDDLSKIRVPMIPIGANWNAYPGDMESRRRITYSDETQRFLHLIAGNVDSLSCREYFTCRMLEKHGIANTLMTGDPAWYDVGCLGKPMRRNRSIDRVLFSPPLSAFYVEQAVQMLEMLAGLFPRAERLCAFHLADADRIGQDFRPDNSAAMRPDVLAKNRRIRAKAAELGFEVINLSGNYDRLAIYDKCDLHVGYECHAHVYALRKRIPSVLIAEDARGVGFAYTFGVGGFHGFRRCQSPPWETGRSPYTSGYCVDLSEFSLAPADGSVHEQIRSFIEEELDSGFRRYIGVAAFLDDTYHSAMKPFLESLP
ncbi:MAG: polysaccharide pyruvyl transferase family protein [Limnochordia bacterium]|jgi:hypothetical protein